MNHFLLPLGAALLLLGAAHLTADDSKGVYRIPYANGTSVNVLNDHLTHNPTNRLDLVGTGGTGPYKIVAAGNGIIRFIVDHHTMTGDCDDNNYVWIEHPNGEWSKYSHLQTGTPTAAGRYVGEEVCAGTYLGDEDDVGCASSIHLHFEVGVPSDKTDPITASGGYLKGVNRIPRFCGEGILDAGDTYTAEPCDTPRMASGVYRLPFENGTQVKVNADHITHTPVQLRYDLVGTPPSRGGPAHVVAAAAGTIRFIVDYHSATGDCDDNNYVWIEHPNGEWTKYSHLQTGTALAAGRYVGEQVCAGTYLGDQDDVGCASIIHLHFEVAVPTDLTDPIDESGGYINGYNLIPVICDIPGNIMLRGETYTAAPCGSRGCVTDILLPDDTVHGALVYMAGDEVDSNLNDFRITSCASVVLSAGQKITLRPGFRSQYRSYLHAVIRECNEMATWPWCNLVAPGGR